MAAERVCAWCGTIFSTNTKRKIHCCTKCKDISFRHGYRYCPICGEKYEITSNFITHSLACDNELLNQYWRDADKSTCAHCGNKFVKEHPNQKYCGSGCKQRASNTRRRNKEEESEEKPEEDYTPPPRNDIEFHREPGTYYSAAQYNPFY